MPELPYVQAFTIPGLELTFVDARVASQDDNVVASRFLNKWLIDEWRTKFDHKQKKPRGLCEQDEELVAERERREHDFMRRNPGRNPGDFRRSREFVTKDIDNDPDLTNVVLIVRDSHDVIGKYVLFNLIVESETRRRFVATCMMLPGIGGVNGLDMIETWAAINTWILQNMIPLNGDRLLDIKAIRFSEDDVTSGFPDEGNGIDRMTSIMVTNGCELVMRQRDPSRAKAIRHAGRQ